MPSGIKSLALPDSEYIGGEDDGTINNDDDSEDDYSGLLPSRVPGPPTITTLDGERGDDIPPPPPPPPPPDSDSENEDGGDNDQVSPLTVKTDLNWVPDLTERPRVMTLRPSHQSTESTDSPMPQAKVDANSSRPAPSLRRRGGTIEPPKLTLLAAAQAVMAQQQQDSLVQLIKNRQPQTTSPPTSSHLSSSTTPSSSLSPSSPQGVVSVSSPQVLRSLPKPAKSSADDLSFPTPRTAVPSRVIYGRSTAPPPPARPFSLKRPPAYCDRILWHTQARADSLPGFPPPQSGQLVVFSGNYAPKVTAPTSSAVSTSPSPFSNTSTSSSSSSSSSCPTGSSASSSSISGTSGMEGLVAPFHVNLLDYSSCEELITSDHVPVRALFRLTIPPPPPPTAFISPCSVAMLQLQLMLMTPSLIPEGADHLYISFHGSILPERSRGKRTPLAPLKSLSDSLQGRDTDGSGAQLGPTGGVHRQSLSPLMVEWPVTDLPVLPLTLGDPRWIVHEKIIFTVYASFQASQASTLVGSSGSANAGTLKPDVMIASGALVLDSIATNSWFTDVVKVMTEGPMDTSEVSPYSSTGTTNSDTDDLKKENGPTTSIKDGGTNSSEGLNTLPSLRRLASTTACLWPFAAQLFSTGSGHPAIGTLQGRFAFRFPCLDQDGVF